MRKWVSSFLIGILALTASTTSTFAAGTSHPSLTTDPAVQVTPITREAYLRVLAKSKQMTLAEADKYDQEQNRQLEEAYKQQHPERLKRNEQGELVAVTAGTYSYIDLSKIQTYSKNPNFSAILLATVKVYSNGSFRSISELNTPASKVKSGMHQYSWVQSYTYGGPTTGMTYPASSVTIGARGYFTSSVTYSITLGGFLLAGQYGNTFTYTSDDMIISMTYSPY